MTPGSWSTKQFANVVAEKTLQSMFACAKIAKTMIKDCTALIAVWKMRSMQAIDKLRFEMNSKKEIKIG